MSDEGDKLLKYFLASGIIGGWVGDFNGAVAFMISWLIVLIYGGWGK